MNVLNIILIPFNNVFFAFCHRCTSCGWKKRRKEMYTETICYGCSNPGALPRRKPVARRVNVAA